jgi:histidinol phosphatase-like enzyme (inositol monophosphatase family)
MSAILSLDRQHALDAFMVELHQVSAPVILPLFRAENGLENKAAPGDFDPVTAADRGAEAAIRKLIGERFPEHGVLGEEYGADRADAEFVWVLDPVDGTRAFISGLPLWTTLIGLRHQGRPVLGSIGQPYIGELFIGGPGIGSRLIGRERTTPLKVRQQPRLTEATLAATDPQAYMTPPEQAAFQQVRAACRLTRLGGDGYLFAMVAAGLIDLVVESGLKAWDIDPVTPVIEGAGGLVTNWRGGPVGPHGGQIIAAGDRRLVDEALTSLRRSAV